MHVFDMSLQIISDNKLGYSKKGKQDIPRKRYNPEQNL